MAKLKTQGTELYMTPDGGTNIYKVGYVTSISGLGGAADQIDVTSFDSAEREFVRGFPNPGQVTVSIVYDTSDPHFGQLQALWGSGAMADWIIMGPGTGTPTWNSGQSRLDPASGRKGLSFDAYVADLTWTFETNEVWRLELTLQRSGAVVFQ